MSMLRAMPLSVAEGVIRAGAEAFTPDMKAEHVASRANAVILVGDAMLPPRWVRQRAAGDVVVMRVIVARY